MQSWIALLPDQRAATAPKIVLLGRLPAEAYISILQFLPIADITSIALCNRQLSTLSKDNSVWKRKLQWLDYRGPGAIQFRQVDSARAAAITERRQSVGIHLASVIPTPKKPVTQKNDFSIDGDDEFGDFFDGDVDGDVSTVHDDGFGDFQDFEDQPTTSRGQSTDPFGLNGFASISLNGGSTIKPDKKADQDLLMMWDEEEPVKIEKVKITRPITPPPPARTSLDRQSYRDIFIVHHHLLLPYYLSLMTHTTSSLVFTSPTLTPSTRSQLLSSLVRFCSPLVAPSRSLPQRTIVLRNVQSSMDFFESAMLAEFERADNRRDEVAMKEKAGVLWELNGGSSVVQVFVQKREIFYDQSHNPLQNLV